MKITKQVIKNILISFLKSLKKKKKLKFDILSSDIDLISDGVLDSIDFLNMVTFLEKKLKKSLDFSEENPKNFSSFNKLVTIVFKRANK